MSKGFSRPTALATAPDSDAVSVLQPPNPVRTFHPFVGIRWLVDDDYVDRLPVHVYPTTWFVDRAGRVAFIREGLKEDLAEDFNWRLDVLRH
jgi:hypothetical protein